MAGTRTVDAVMISDFLRYCKYCSWRNVVSMLCPLRKRLDTHSGLGLDKKVC